MSTATPADLAECVAETMHDATGAHLRVRALLELLHGCPPDYPLSAGLFLGLIESVREQLDNVVDGLRVVQAGSPLCVVGDAS